MVTKVYGDTGVDKIVDGTITSSDLASGVGGKVLQVVSTIKTDTFSTTTTIASGGALVTGLSATITPLSTSSKILILCTLHTDGTATVTQAYAWLARGSTKIGAGDNSGSRIGVGTRGYYGDNNVSNALSMNYLDSPSTTSSTTYNVYVGTQGSGTVVVNRTINDTNNAGDGARTASTITLMEISQ